MTPRSCGCLRPWSATRPSRATAVEALSRIAPERWPGAEVAGLVENLLAYARTVPAADRTAPAFKQAIALGRGAAARLPGDEAARITSALDALTVRTIRIKAAARADEVRHLEVLGRAGGGGRDRVRQRGPHAAQPADHRTRQARRRQPEGRGHGQRSPTGSRSTSCPDTPEVLHATRLINHEEIARLRFTAPTAEGKYPYVCTFPGHWRTMNGVMDVQGRGTRDE